ncbi:MAG: CvpA family protein [Treponema sp.]|nr:CvpA family protein [Treponema sp.]
MMFPAIDVVFLIIVFGFAVFGAINGFLNEVFGKAAPVVSAWTALLFYSRLVGPIEMHLKVHFVSVVLAFLLIFIISFIIMKIIQTAVKNIFGGDIFKDLDRLLGFVFGLAEGLVIVGVILIFMQAQPWFKTEPMLSGSFFARILQPFISVPLQSITSAVEHAAVQVPD